MEAGSSIVAAISSPGPRSARPDLRLDFSARLRRLLLLAGMATALLNHAAAKSHQPVLLWNLSASVPEGLYVVTDGAPSRGQLAVIQLPEAPRAFADARGYLPRHALLIKPVVAVTGDSVCRYGRLVTINGRLRAVAGSVDGRRRLLPRWRGCRHLRVAEFFVLSAVSGSFDSRYFGPIKGNSVLGTAVPIWTY